MAQSTDIFIKDALENKPVFISDIREAYNELPKEECHTLCCVLEPVEETLLEKTFFINFSKETSTENIFFCNMYVLSELYNIISIIGGRQITIYADMNDEALMELIAEIKNAFGSGEKRSKRFGYGLCVNVAERICASCFNSLFKDKPYEFQIVCRNISELANRDEIYGDKEKKLCLEKKLTDSIKKIEGKIICGIDVGGTDIKAVIVRDSKIKYMREYNWDPASHTNADRTINVILLIIRLLRCQLSLELCNDISEGVKAYCRKRLIMASNANPSYSFMVIIATEIEKILANRLVKIDAIGVAYPDVVVNNRIVGGETTKTQGMRNNKKLDYEKEYSKVTQLNKILMKNFDNAAVKIINDGFMAAFASAVELAHSPDAHRINNGVFAYAIGTELGVGWINSNGVIPKIPLNGADVIIDLGSLVAANISHEKIGSIKNTNTGISGTLQQYVSQNGVFRLSLDKRFKKKPKDLNFLLSEGFLQAQKERGSKYFLFNGIKDMRKKFLDYIVRLLVEGDDADLQDIFRETGKYLGYGEIEFDHILSSDVSLSVLYGRVVKNRQASGVGNSIALHFFFLK